MGKFRDLLLRISPGFAVRFARAVQGKIYKLLAEERKSGYYDDIFDDKKSTFRAHYSGSPYFFMWSALAERLLLLGRDIKILDLGCGPGQVANLLKDKGFKNYTGVDFSESGIRIARDLGTGYEFICTDVLKSDVLEKTDYNCVMALEFFEHINDDIAILARIKKGAKIIASVPDFPAPSHVRHFENEAQVRERYEKLFSDFKVDSFKKGRESWFVFEGTKI